VDSTVSGGAATGHQATAARRLPSGTWARRRGSDRNTPSAESLAQLLQQHVNAGLNIRVVDVADRTRRGLNKVDDIGAIGQFARRHPFTDVTTHGPVRRVLVFILVEIDLQETVSNGATAGGVDCLDGNTINLDDLARVNPF